MKRKKQGYFIVSKFGFICVKQFPYHEISEADLTTIKGNKIPFGNVPEVIIK